VLGVGTFIGNPLDSGFAGLGSKEVYIECVSALLDDPAIDILLLQEELPRGPGSERKEANLHAVNALAPRSKKPIVHVTMISHGLTDYSRALREQLPNIGFMQEVDKTLRTVRAIATYAHHAAVTDPSF
jgi:acetate---CoA ligase (ADP-forming)